MNNIESIVGTNRNLSQTTDNNICNIDYNPNVPSPCIYDPENGKIRGKVITNDPPTQQPPVWNFFDKDDDGVYKVEENEKEDKMVSRLNLDYLSTDE